jgi:DNA-binding helix-hairpin-helix protein with protein kinase domain
MGQIIFLTTENKTQERVELEDLEIAEGGAGKIYHIVGDASRVVKIYHEKTLLKEGSTYEKKIWVMLNKAPTLLDPIQLAWPLATAKDVNDRFVGFSMPTMDLQKTIELQNVLQDKQANLFKLKSDLESRMVLAHNLAVIVHNVHEKGHGIVDMKPTNMKFYKEEQFMALLDCDGFYIEGFAAPQVTPEYVAPEFYKRVITNPFEQDKFALAVIIFQLLNFGIHPYSCKPTTNDGINTIEGRIRHRHYAYALSPANGISVEPIAASTHICWPDQVRILFDLAFGNQGIPRPSAREWVEVLASYVRLLERCGDRHFHFPGMSCGNCLRDVARGNQTSLSLSTSAQNSTGSLDDELKLYQNRDYIQAMRVARVHAAKGDTVAMCLIALMYQYGEGVPKNDKEVIKWLRLASDQGDSGAQYELGNMYLKGEGVSKNDQEAFRFFTLAAAGGHIEAEIELRKLNSRNIGKNSKPKYQPQPQHQLQSQPQSQHKITPQSQQQITPFNPSATKGNSKWIGLAVLVFGLAWIFYDKPVAGIDQEIIEEASQTNQEAAQPYGTQSIEEGAGIITSGSVVSHASDSELQTLIQNSNEKNLDSAMLENANNSLDVSLKQFGKLNSIEIILPLREKGTSEYELTWGKLIRLSQSIADLHGGADILMSFSPNTAEDQKVNPEIMQEFKTESGNGTIRISYMVDKNMEENLNRVTLRRSAVRP